jgi:hypothetical protein
MNDAKNLHIQVETRWWLGKNLEGVGREWLYAYIVWRELMHTFFEKNFHIFTQIVLTYSLMN